MHTQTKLCLEWRIPPSRCCAWANPRMNLSRSQLHLKTVTAAATQDREVYSIPESREEAVKVSAAALLGQIKQLKGAKRANKGFGATSSTAPAGTRFSIELPLAGDSPEDTAALTRDILAALPPSAVAGASIVCASEQVAAAVASSSSSSSGRQGGPVLSLRQACQAASLSGPLLVVEPATADVALVEQLLDEVWSGPWVLLVNPTWHTSTPPQYQPLVDSFQAAYSFMPIATQGLLRAEGAVLRELSGSPSSSPWRVLMKQGEQFVQVGQMKKRPAQSDLELVFMNARAASSPLTSLVKGVKGMLDKGKKQ